MMDDGKMKDEISTSNIKPLLFVCRRDLRDGRQFRDRVDDLIT